MEILRDRVTYGLADYYGAVMVDDLDELKTNVEERGAVTLRERIRLLCRSQRLVVDEIGYLPVVAGGGNLFFQLVNARYERGAISLTSNRGFAEWGEVFGDTVVVTALLDPPALRHRRPHRGRHLSSPPPCRPAARPRRSARWWAMGRSSASRRWIAGWRGSTATRRCTGRQLAGRPARISCWRWSS
ncbi:ATP-binding protein [Roseomonas fluvialis]|uniref:ATP-binding protein n=1 Tax=Roseomonas fluvialis TaxID=1750527 RepID=UPI002434304F|nr:ATP-binding protein [Roseomonas fluvialis]